jgi:Na+/H+ antiporter NhaD/arsenite permease-like protein
MPAPQLPESPLNLKPLQALAAALRDDALFRILLMALPLLALVSRAPLETYPGLVDWPTILTLSGLLMLTKGVEMSGYLPIVAQRLLGLMPSERALALFLVLATALLATVLTNDVALFVMVPLTLALAGTGASLGKLIIFEAMAANAGSTLTPIGNPQNLFLWQLSQASFGLFLDAMLPLACALLLALALLTLAAFSGRKLHVPEQRLAEPNRRLLAVALTLYPPFLLLTDMRHPLLGLALVLLTLGLGWRRILASVDWGLILVFVLMFIDLRLLGGLEPISHWIAGLDLKQTAHLYLGGLAASQLISNVPAAILLAEYSRDWKTIAYSVNAGGFGFMLGSLANIIALRMAPDRRTWLHFHAWSVPFLLVAAGLAWLLR